MPVSLPVQDNKNKIDVLTQDIAKAQSELDYYLKKVVTEYNKDNPDQQFSAYYNDKIKSSVVDAFEKTEKGNTYQNFLKPEYQKFKEFQTTYEDVYAEQKAVREEGLKDIDARIKNLTQFTKGENRVESLKKLSGEIASIVATVEKIGSDPTISEAFKPIFDQVIAEIVGTDAANLKAVEELKSDYNIPIYNRTLAVALDKKNAHPRFLKGVIKELLDKGKHDDPASTW